LCSLDVSVFVALLDPSGAGRLFGERTLGPVRVLDDLVRRPRPFFRLLGNRPRMRVCLVNCLLGGLGRLRGQRSSLDHLLTRVLDERLCVLSHSLGLGSGPVRLGVHISGDPLDPFLDILFGLLAFLIDQAIETLASCASANACCSASFARATAVSARLSLIPTESGPPGSLSVTAIVIRRKPSVASCAVDSVAATGDLSAFDNSHAPLLDRSLSPDTAWLATHLTGRILDMETPL
jgi:hypothetical protein